MSVERRTRVLPRVHGPKTELKAGSDSNSEAIARLENVVRDLDSRPLPLDEEGAQLLEALKLVDRIGDAIRERYRRFLVDHPGAVPGWKVEVVEILKLVRDSGGEEGTRP